MKTLLRSLSVVLAALSLNSCLQNETTVRLNKDGSGTLVEETLLGAQMLAMLEQMSAVGGAAAGDPVAEMFSEDKAKARTAALGEGVTFEKNEPITKNGSKGNRTTYRFADINKLKVSASDGLKDLSPMGGQAPATPDSKPMTFRYADGQLTITLPEPEPADVPAAEGDAGATPGLDEMGEEQTAMMKQMMSDMKVSLKVIIESGIAETNATHREGDTVTLMEMEMGKVFENPENLKKLGKIDQGNPAAAMEMMKGIPGMKVEAQKEVTIKVN